MALNDAATLVINTGNFFTAPVGTALPSALGTIIAPWVNVGHTSIEDIFNITSDGGEQTVLGTLQNQQLRSRFSARTETMTFTLQQFDTAGLKLFYGSNATIGTGGEVQVPVNPVPTQAAFLAVFADGVNKFAFYVPKADIFRADDMSLSDTESLAGLPLGITPLVHNTNAWTYAVTPLVEDETP